MQSDDRNIGRFLMCLGRLIHLRLLSFSEKEKGYPPTLGAGVWNNGSLNRWKLQAFGFLDFF
jgi:hypothetical protein